MSCKLKSVIVFSTNGLNILASMEVREELLIVRTTVVCTHVICTFTEKKCGLSMDPCGTPNSHKR